MKDKIIADVNINTFPIILAEATRKVLLQVQDDPHNMTLTIDAAVRNVALIYGLGCTLMPQEKHQEYEDMIIKLIKDYFQKARSLSKKTQEEIANDPIFKLFNGD